MHAAKIFSSDMGKMMGQTDFFNYGIPTSKGE